jgi:hypothetical protein
MEQKEKEKQTVPVLLFEFDFKKDVYMLLNPSGLFYLNYQPVTGDYFMDARFNDKLYKIEAVIHEAAYLHVALIEVEKTNKLYSIVKKIVGKLTP